MRYKVNIPSGETKKFKVVSGNYTVLYQYIGGKWMNIMEDTELEANQAHNFLSAATGDVLLAGLGLGMVIKPLLDNESVASITIVEKFQEVIDLVWKHVPKSDKVKLIKDDIYSWIPQKSYDVAWFDSYIYPQDGSDPLGEYLDDMTNKYRTYVGSAYFWPGGSVTIGNRGW